MTAKSNHLMTGDDLAIWLSLHPKLRIRSEQACDVAVMDSWYADRLDGYTPSQSAERDTAFNEARS